MTKRRLFLASLLPAATLAAVLVVPAWRWGVVGLVRGESFFQGRPTSYWAQVLRDRWWKTSGIHWPPLWDQLLIRARALAGHDEEVADLLDRFEDSSPSAGIRWA